MTSERLNRMINVIIEDLSDNDDSIGYTKGDNMPRKYTNELLEMIEDGLLNKSDVILACINYMSEDEVKDMMQCNEFTSDET